MDKINNFFDNIYEKIPGGVFGLLGIIFLFFITAIAQSLFPGFNNTVNYISDLGAHPSSALIFNVGMFIAGFFVILYFMYFTRSLETEELSENKRNLLSITVIIGGICFSLIGIFPFIPNTIFLTIHLIVAIPQFIINSILLIDFSWLMKSDSRFSTAQFIVALLPALLNAFFVAIFLLSLLAPPVLVIFEHVASYFTTFWWIETAIYSLYKKI